MQKITFTLLLSMLLSTAIVLGQTQDNVKFTICGTPDSVIKHADLSKCAVLVPVNKNLTIKSFALTFLVLNADSKTEGVYADFTCTGNKLSDAASEALKKTAPGTKILIENIIASDGTTEKKYPGFIIQTK